MAKMMECYFQDYFTNKLWAQFCISLLIFASFREACAKYYAWRNSHRLGTAEKVAC